jgi:hypothetical protein
MDSRNVLRPLQHLQGFGGILEAAKELDACRSNMRLTNLLVGLTVPQPTELVRERNMFLGRMPSNWMQNLGPRDSLESDDRLL